uniref:Zinc finger and BTB domain containing 46 n=1 Tax=Hucho hucho TaxID=62062 RepID=A0A4W5Q439_9TELE
MNSNRKEDMEISSHYRQLLRELNEQRQHGILCDACVIVDGKIFKAHKNILLGSSRYFKTLYCQVKKGAEPHHQTTVTHLDIVTATGFKAILDFMYSAHLALTSKNVIEVMSAASYLQMTDIVQACHGFIKAALDISIRSELADELADFEMGAAAGVASEALVSIISGRSSSPWLGRRTSPANSSGDSAIASCHEGSGSTYGKEDQEPPKSHESQEDGGHDSQPAWPHNYRPITVKEEQVSPSSVSQPRDGPNVGAGTQGDQGGGGEGPWQPSGSGRRKNRKNKDTVRHITQQAEGDRDSRPGSPLPSMMGVTGWSYNGKDIPGRTLLPWVHGRRGEGGRVSGGGGRGSGGGRDEEEKDRAGWEEWGEKERNGWQVRREEGEGKERGRAEEKKVWGKAESETGEGER